MDHFQTLKQSTIHSLFGEEYQWMIENRWNLAEHNSEYLLLLDADKMSLFHLAQIRKWMEGEAAEKAKKLEDEQKKVRNIDPRSLTGSGRHY